MQCDCDKNMKLIQFLSSSPWCCCWARFFGWCGECGGFHGNVEMKRREKLLWAKWSENLKVTIWELAAVRWGDQISSLENIRVEKRVNNDIESFFTWNLEVSSTAAHTKFNRSTLDWGSHFFSPWHSQSTFVSTVMTLGTTSQFLLMWKQVNSCHLFFACLSFFLIRMIAANFKSRRAVGWRETSKSTRNFSFILEF